VRKHFQERFTHLFVDEFQDTDPLQAEILVLLSASDAAANNWRSVTPVPGKLFIVGDPKQAIYRFRRADVGTYEESSDNRFAMRPRSCEAKCGTSTQGRIRKRVL
jgi:ATP-dependent exoDNAse (exonuclease V) beta subunit